MTVFDLSPGDLATVTAVNGTGAIRQRLLDMGIVPKAQLSIARIAPGGGPIWIKLSDSQFALRTQEAQAVEVERA